MTPLRTWDRRCLRPFLAGMLLALALGSPIDGQTGPQWNAPVVVELLEQARALRASTAVNDDFRSYQAEARGRVYFYVDRPDSAALVLVKGDQVALDLYWLAPNTTKQWIVGRRDEKVLPTSIRYHLDHLTVVQDDFADFIRLGDGDEVARVAHPIGPLGQAQYDFALSDSLRISYAGGAEEIRVYEIQVRPKNMDAPGFVGTVFLDRDRAAIVRMNFSFTPVSYVDPYLDYIRVSMDNSLWLGRYWLPYRQEFEIRREIPLLDFQSGSTIRTQFEVGAYEFNPDIPPRLLTGSRVRSVSTAQQLAFPFQEGVFSGLTDPSELEASPTMREVESQVREVVGDQVMSGLAPVRLHLARLSDFARYNRAEGVFVGGGLTFRPVGDLQLRTTAGYAFGRRRASGTLAIAPGQEGTLLPTADLYWDAMGDMGGHPGATMLENTLTSASASEDFLDPYFRRGGTITFGGRPRGRPALALTVEEQASAVDVVSDDPDSGFRPVRTIDDGTWFSLSGRARLPSPAAVRAWLTITGGTVAERKFASALLESAWTVGSPETGWSGELAAWGGITNPGAPAQALFLIGGRHTLPGHDYRSFAGNAYGLVRAEVTVPVLPPWLGLRAFTAWGGTHLAPSAAPPSDWDARDSGGIRGSVGVGLSVGWDVMRFDVGHGVRGGGWEAVFSVAPRFRSWM